MSETQVVIGPVRLSYAHIWEATVAKGSTDAKFSVSLIISKDDKKNLAIIDNAVKAACELGKGKFGAAWPKKPKLPLRDGDDDNATEGIKDYEGCMFLSASSSKQPGIVDKNKQPIVNEEEVYSGCYAYVAINFYPFNNKLTGVAVGLNHIMKFKDGDRLDGRVSADKAFEGVNFDDTEADEEVNPLD